MIDKENSDKEKKTKQHLATTAKQSSVVFLSLFIGYFLGFVINYIIAKYFGPKIMGQYTITRTTVDIVVIFSVFGLNNGLLKYVNKYKVNDEINKTHNTIKIAFRYSILFSILSMIIILLSSRILAIRVFNDNELIKPLFYGSFLVIPLTMRRIFNGLYRSFKKLKYYIVSVEVIRRLLFLIILIILFKFSFAKSTVIILSLLLVEIFNNIYLYKKSDSLNLNLRIIIFSSSNIDFSFKKEILSYSATVIFIHFMQRILNKMDRIMLGIFSSTSSVGIYNTASTVTILLTFFMISSNTIFSSVISELFNENEIGMLEKLYSTTTKWLIVLTLPIMLNILFFSKTIMGVFGEEYIIASTALIILSFGQLINVSTGAGGYILNLCGYEKKLLKNVVFMVIINLLLNFFLIPKFNMIGAAASSAIAIIIFNLIKIIQIKIYLGIFPYNIKSLKLIYNFAAITLFLLIVSRVSSSILTLMISTIISIMISSLISYFYRDELDEFVFNKAINKIKRYLN